MLIITVFALYGAVIAMAIIIYLLCDEIRKLKKKQKKMQRSIKTMDSGIRVAYQYAAKAQNKAVSTAAIVRSLVDSPVTGRHVRNEDDHEDQN